MHKKIGKLKKSDKHRFIGKGLKNQVAIKILRKNFHTFPYAYF